MEVRPIKTEEDYRDTLREIELLMTAAAGSPEGERLDVLVTLVEAYERQQLSSGLARSGGGDQGAGLAVPSRRLCNLAALTNHNGDRRACMTEHLDQAVDTEAIDLPSHEIADPRLRHPETLGCCRLCEALGLNQLGQLNHQVGSNLEVLRLVFAEAEIPEDIAARASSSHGHLKYLIWDGSSIQVGV